MINATDFMNQNGEIGYKNFDLADVIRVTKGVVIIP